MRGQQTDRSADAYAGVFSCRMSGGGYEAVVDPLEGETPSIAFSDGQHQPSRMLRQVPCELHQIADDSADPSAAYIFTYRIITLFQ